MIMKEAKINNVISSHTDPPLTHTYQTNHMSDKRNKDRITTNLEKSVFIYIPL
jgi:hypothetical protein